MSIIKCKMCGGDLNFIEGMTTAECEYCGTLQTIPTLDDEKKLIQFERAELLRKKCEFDKAAGIYETIVVDYRQEAEAYWGLVLCKYGIEYVDDPATGKKIPTCHRSSFDSIMEDSDFERVLENADTVARKVYRDEAKAIEEIRKGIISVSVNEKTYDIFICYKETDEKGERTIDSVLAQDVYDALSDKGYRVFFSRITLEDKLGIEYEPYIFAALNSAKIMLVFGTDYEYFNAVWVKNEWSRFLKLMAKDKEKYLIPCYKDIDAYDMPKEFAKLQAQDMGKVGAVQDLMRGIEKLLPRKQENAKETVVIKQNASGSDVSNLLNRAFMFLEDEDWDKADEYCEKVLDIDSECAKAYLGKLLSELKLSKEELLVYQQQRFDSMNNYKKAVRFADHKLCKQLRDYAEISAKNIVNANLKKEQLSALHKRAKKVQNLFGVRDDYVGLKSDGTICVFSKKKEIQEHFQREKVKWSNLERIIYNTDIIGITFDRNIVSIDPRIEKIAKDRQDIKDVGVCDDTVIVLESNGRISTYGGYNDSMRDELSRWSDVVDIVILYRGVIGLRSDGRVLCVGIDEEIKDKLSKWCDISVLKTSFENIVGIRSNGRVVAIGYGTFVQHEISQWRNIVDLCVTFSHMVGLSADGRVFAIGENEYGECNVSDWKDIVSIAGGDGHTVGLKSDGTVVAVGENEDGQCDVSGWRDVVAIGASWGLTIGVRSDGTVLAAGINESGELNAVRTWKLFNNINTLDDEIAETKKCAEEERIAQKRKKEEEEQLLRIECENKAKQDEIDRQNRIEKLSAVRKKLKLAKEIVSVWAGQTVAVNIDGTVEGVGNREDRRLDVKGWRNIRSVSTSYWKTAGLRYDGTVVLTGNNKNTWEGDAENWRDIVYILKGDFHTLGLCRDGNILCAGNRHSTGSEWTVACEWKNIAAVAGSSFGLAGLTKDGKIVGAGHCGKWPDNTKDVVDICLGTYHIVLLYNDGHVEVHGGQLFKNEFNESDVSGWSDIVAVSSGGEHTVGLKSDGTVVAVGNNEYGQCNVSSWNDIVGIYAASRHTVGLRSDGTLVATGDNSSGQCDVPGWKLFNDFYNLEEERKTAHERMSQGVCPYCGGNYKGLLTKKCINCGRAKSY